MFLHPGCKQQDDFTQQLCLSVQTFTCVFEPVSK